jgi:hypothetical protein
MAPLPILVDPNVQHCPGKRDFGAVVRDGALVIPADLGVVAVQNHLDTAELFFSFAEVFPTTIARALGGAPEDVKPAVARLADVLRGHVEDALLAPFTPVKRAYGALPPPGRKSN